VQAARRRIRNVPEAQIGEEYLSTPDPRKRERIPFGRLLETGLIRAGDVLTFDLRSGVKARVCADGSLSWNGKRGSIHQIARTLNGGPCNGWDHWLAFERRSGKRIPIDRLRERLRNPK
jgi:modification methylase